MKMIQENINQQINHIHELVTTINMRGSHIIFYNVSPHIDQLQISIRQGHDYNLKIMDLESYTKIKSVYEPNNDVYNQNLQMSLNAMREVLTHLMHYPDVTCVSEIINNQLLPVDMSELQPLREF